MSCKVVRVLLCTFNYFFDLKLELGTNTFPISRGFPQVPTSDIEVKGSS